MPLPLQAKLLRFLQERTIERVGGRVEIPVDVRVICATNKNLDAMVAEGTFREDLYYRICEMVIDIPPLRDRQGDKILLARYFFENMAPGLNNIVSGFSIEAAEAIEAYPWPGNIREMENKIKRAIIMCDGKLLTPEDLAIGVTEELSINLRQVREHAEKNAIIQALSVTDGNYSLAAKMLGVSRPTFYNLISKYDITL